MVHLRVPDLRDGLLRGRRLADRALDSSVAAVPARHAGRARSRSVRGHLQVRAAVACPPSARSPRDNDTVSSQAHPAVRGTKTSGYAHLTPGAGVPRGRKYDVALTGEHEAAGGRVGR